MLSKKDLNEIRTIIQEELKAALTIEVQYEKFNKDKGAKELKIEKHFLPILVLVKSWCLCLFGLFLFFKFYLVIIKQ